MVRRSPCERREDGRSSLGADARRAPFSLGMTVSIEGEQMKGSQKPKKLGKKPPQKTLKEKRAAKRQAAKS